MHSGVAGVECCSVFTEHVNSGVAGVECCSVFTEHAHSGVAGVECCSRHRWRTARGGRMNISN